MYSYHTQHQSKRGNGIQLGKYTERNIMKRFLKLFRKQQDEQPKESNQEFDKFVTINLLKDNMFEYHFRLTNLTDTNYKVLFTLLSRECISNIIMLMREDSPEEANLMTTKYIAYIKSLTKKTKKPLVSPLHVLGKKDDGYNPLDSNA